MGYEYSKIIREGFFSAQRAEQNKAKNLDFTLFSRLYHLVRFNILGAYQVSEIIVFANYIEFTRNFLK